MYICTYIYISYMSIVCVCVCIKGLFTEREVCTVKYRTEDISRYRPNKRGQ